MHGDIKLPLHVAGIDFAPETFDDVMIAATNSSQTDFMVVLTILDDQVVENVEFLQLTATAQDSSNNLVSSNLLSIGITDNGDSKSSSV